MSNLRGKNNYSKIIESDQFLSKIYDETYKTFYEIAKRYGFSNAKALEIGAGDFSLSHKYFENVKKSDINASQEAQTTEYINSEFLPFEDESFDCVLAKDALHHFKNPYASLLEVHRVLKPSGVFIVCEPYWSLSGRFIFKFIHPEDWNASPSTLELKSSNPWDSNQALLYLLNGKFKSELADHVPGFNLKILNSGYGLVYAVSGGVFSRTKIPAVILLVLHKLEKKCIKPLKRIIGLNIFAVFEKEF